MKFEVKRTDITGEVCYQLIETTSNTVIMTDFTPFLLNLECERRNNEAKNS